MGFDNECILNIQSLAGEYFCPVCRLLVYPNEAIQSQCTHLYCKPCLSYVVSTTKACPYDGYLVTEEHSKPLIESNKTLAETIGKIAVHCLYHRSGCTWQGQLSECITHCTSCAFGNSPVVCNRCGTQIVHRQVQEHAQNCPGVQPQAQQVEGSQDATTSTNATAVSEQNQAATQAGAPAAQTQVAQTAVAPSSGQDQSQVSTTSQPQPAVQAVTTEQWYQQQQQQYQQYYQQYPGYDPYQQQYQQYGSYPQQAYQQYQQQPPQAIPGQQPQMYMQPQPQTQAQLPVRPQAQLPTQPQPQTQPQVQAQTQVGVQPQAQAQTQVGVQPQVQAQANMSNQVQPSHSHPQVQQQSYPQQPQPYSQAQPYQQPHPPQPQVQPHLQQRPQVPQQQQQPISYPPQPHQQAYPYPQAQLPAQTQLHPQSQAQTQLHPQSQAQYAQMQPQARPQSQTQHPSHAVTGHQSYPQPQPNQQLPSGASQGQSMYVHPQQQGAPSQQPQQTVQMQAQFTQQQVGQMRPPPSHVPMHQQQLPAMLPPQGQHPNLPPPPQTGIPQGYQANQPAHQYLSLQSHPHKVVSQQLAHGHSLHPHSLPGQTPVLVQSTPPQAAPYGQTQAVHPQLRPQVPPSVLPAGSSAQQQLQQNVPVSHSLQSQSQNYPGHTMLPNHGVPHQTFQPAPVGPGGPAHAKATQLGGAQLYPPRPNLHPQSSAEQQRGYVNQAMPPQSVNETSQYPSSAAPLYGTKTDANETNVLVATSSQGTHLVESWLGKTETDLKADFERKSMDGDKASVDVGEGNHSNSDVKHISSQNLEKDPASSQNGLDDSVVKNMTKEEGIGKPESSSGASSETAVQNLEGHVAHTLDDNSQLVDKEIDDVRKNVSSQASELPNGMDVRELPNGMRIPNDAVISQEMVTSQGKVLGTERNNNEAHSLTERNMLQSQNSRQGPGQVQDSQQLIMNCGNSHVEAQGHPRPAAPDQMLLQTIHPHQMQIPGPPPTHLRPQGHSLLGNMPQQGHLSSVAAHFQQPFAKQPFGSILPEVLPGGIHGPGSSALAGRGGPGPFGPQGHLNTGQMLPHQIGNPRMQGDPMGRPAFGGPLPGPYESQGIAGRIPPHDRQMPTNPMDSEFIANKRTDYFDGRQFDPHMRGSADAPFGHPPNMQSDYMKFNGGPARGVSTGLSDPAYPFGLQDERFKHFSEERYRQFPGSNLPGGERLGNFSVESGRRILNHREFLDELKHFPRPTHLDSEHVPKPESYFSSRPFDRAPHGFAGDARLKLDGGASSAPSRLLPPYQPGDLRPINIRDDIAGRKVDPLHPDFNRPSLESGRIRTDGLPPLRSPGRDYSDIPSNRFGRIGRESRAFGERSKLFNVNSDTNPFLERRFPILPSHLLRGELDGPGRIGERVHLRGGELVGLDMLHSGGPVGPHNLHMGEPGGYGTHPNPLRLGDLGGPGNLPLNRRIGDSIGGNLTSHSRPGFSSSMPIHPFSSDAGLFNAGEVGSLDNSRKRKHGSTG